MRFRAILACAVALAGPIHARAQQPPTDTDLKAAYCIGVTQQTLSLIPSDLPASASESMRDRLQHLQQYLLPRMPYIDPLGIAAARSRGQGDAASATTPEALACAARCPVPPANTDPLEAMKQCALSCDTGHRLPRIWACNDLSWLPF